MLNQNPSEADKWINKIHCGNALETLRRMPSEFVDSVVCSPPYFNLRDYGIDGQIGLEPTYQEFISKLCNIFDEVKRVLKKTGTCFVNMGDSYVGGFGYENLTDEEFKKKYPKQGRNTGTSTNRKLLAEIKHANRQLPQKSLMLIPERFAIEMCSNEWQLRDDITEEEKKYVLTELIKRDIL